jgi:hypothetical protein
LKNNERAPLFQLLDRSGRVPHSDGMQTAEAGLRRVADYCGTSEGKLHYELIERIATSAFDIAFPLEVKLFPSLTINAAEIFTD